MKLMSAAIVLLVIGIGFLIYHVEGQRTYYRAKCEDQGGFYFSTRDGSICIAKSAVIKLTK